MQATLNSPQAFKMAVEMLGKNKKIRMYVGQSNFSGANVVRKRVEHKCCAAANSNNRSKKQPDLFLFLPLLLGYYAEIILISFHASEVNKKASPKPC